MKKAQSLHEIESALGESIKMLRLQKNIDRQTLCDQAGVSMNALRHLESGAGVSVKTLILIIRALGRLDWFDNLAPQTSINPLHMLRDLSPRERASRRSSTNGKNKKN